MGTMTQNGNSEGVDLPQTKGEHLVPLKLQIIQGKGVVYSHFGNRAMEKMWKL